MRNKSDIINLRPLTPANAMNRLTILLLLLTTVAISADEPAKAYPLDTCVVSGEALDPTVPPLVYKGWQVRFCCKGCIKKFNASPDKYVAKLDALKPKK